MSIAVSAVLRTSRRLRLALACFATLNGCAALLLAWPWLGGRLGGTGGPIGSHVGGAWIALACAAAAGLTARAAAKAAMRGRIDISGPGEIRLTVQHGMEAAGESGCSMVLMPGSTVWPQCQLLLLRPQAGGAMAVLVLLPDSVDREQFRAIAVAIRAIAGRDNKFFRKNKIL